jgi:hypothetical protein
MHYINWVESAVKHEPLRFGTEVRYVLAGNCQHMLRVGFVACYEARASLNSVRVHGGHDGANRHRRVIESNSIHVEPAANDLDGFGRIDGKFDDSSFC